MFDWIIKFYHEIIKSGETVPPDRTLSETGKTEEEAAEIASGEIREDEKQVIIERE